ncbi:MAG TPA: sigma 54-interacting transcriptional regulator [Vicinamibacterales bacterium]|nr:sigma 54-interacting transcriptional regulator [Vicinamibacterales bacterium]
MSAVSRSNKNVGRSAPADGNVASEARRLSTLLEVSQALSGTLNLKASLHRVLEILTNHHGAVRGLVSLLHGDGDLRVEASDGLADTSRPVRYQMGEGITGKVVESGKPIVVPRVSREPAFLHRAARRPELAHQELSFICVPIVLNRRAIGALAIDLKFKPERTFDRSLKFLVIVASMIAQAIKIHRLIDEDKRKLVDENTHLRQELRERYDFSNFVGSSGPMRQLFEQVTQVAGTNTTVLVRGESGTGKELIAHAIHYSSLRAKKPFVKVSCAALPDSLIESELFGYEKGAFTGAEARKKGRFELADGGTLFLDEIGEVNLATQVKLLRVLQQREFERVGGTETVKANVRLIAATNKDLEKAIASGTFREDLYYRLNVFTMFVPPLRERKADLLLLVDHFLEKFAREHQRSIKRISTPAIDMLASYHWPGNVRELENAIERSVLMCDGQVIHGHHLPPSLQTAEASGTVTRVSLLDAVSAYEKDLLQDALKTTRGNCARAARLLDTTERIFNYKVRNYAIDTQRFKS